MSKSNLSVLSFLAETLLICKGKADWDACVGTHALYGAETASYITYIRLLVGRPHHEIEAIALGWSKSRSEARRGVSELVLWALDLRKTR